jgi:hypothetical protein
MIRNYGVVTIVSASHKNTNQCFIIASASRVIIHIFCQSAHQTEMFDLCRQRDHAQAAN